MFRTFLKELRKLTFINIMMMLSIIIIALSPGMGFICLVLLTVASPDGIRADAVLPIAAMGLVAWFVSMPISILFATIHENATDDDDANNEDGCEYSLCECARHNLPPFFNFTTRAWEAQPCGNESCSCLEHTHQEKFIDGKWIIA